MGLAMSKIFQVPMTHLSQTTQPTQMDAWVKVQENLADRQKLVLRVIQAHYPITMHGVADILEVPLNTISGRFSELRGKDSIKKVGVKDGKSLWSPIIFKEGQGLLC